MDIFHKRIDEEATFVVENQLRIAFNEDCFEEPDTTIIKIITRSRGPLSQPLSACAPTASMANFEECNGGATDTLKSLG